MTQSHQVPESLVLDLPREHLDLMWTAVDFAAKAAPAGEAREAFRQLARRFKPSWWSSKGRAVQVSPGELVMIGRIMVLLKDRAPEDRSIHNMAETLAPYFRAAITALGGTPAGPAPMSPLEPSTPPGNPSPFQGSAEMQQAAQSVRISRIELNPRAQVRLFVRCVRRKIPEDRAHGLFDLHVGMTWVVTNYYVAMESGLPIVEWDRAHSDLKRKAAKHGVTSTEWDACYEMVVERLHEVVREMKTQPQGYDSIFLRHIDLSVAESPHDGAERLILDSVVAKMHRYVKADRRSWRDIKHCQPELADRFYVDVCAEMPDIVHGVQDARGDSKVIVVRGVQVVLDAMHVAETLGGSL